MKQVRRMMRRVRGLFGGASADAEMERELAAHVTLLEDEMVRRGETPEEARRLARVRLGGLEQTRMMHREERGLPFLESLMADVRYGWRQLRKRKVTTAAAVLSLALGIGSCMAAFRLVDALFLRPLPIAHPERLYRVEFRGMDEMGKPQVDDGTAYRQLEAMQGAVRGQAEVLGATYIYRSDVHWGGDAEMAAVQYVSGRMFAAFGLKPGVGRLLTEADDRTPGGGPYVVLAYDYWQRRLGGDAGVVGRTLRMGDTVLQVVGVAPKGFTGTQPGRMAEVFAPLTMSPNAKMTDVQWFRTLVMAGPGVPVKTLEEKLGAADHAARSGIFEEMKQRIPNFPKQMVDLFLNQRVTLAPAGTGASRLREDYGTSLLVLSVLAGMVLLIACVNVANLLAGLAATRSREMAVRVSLGAGRGRLLRLVMLESAMVGVSAAVLGVLFAWWASPLVVQRLGAGSTAIELALDVNARVMLFGAGMTLVTTMLFGLAPALRSARVQPASALKGGADQPAKLRWMHGMTGAQAAFCVMVLFAAGLFVRSFAGLALKPLGFAAERVAVLGVNAQQDEPLAAWQQRMERLRALPGVERVSMSNVAMLSGEWMTTHIQVEGQGVSRTPVYEVHVSPGWLETMHIPLLGGRELRESDTAPGAALVNEAFAREYFRGANPMGQRFAKLGSSHAPNFEIVGLIGDAMYSDVHKVVQPTIYLPMRAAAGPSEVAKLSGGILTVRTASDPVTMLEMLQQSVREMTGVRLTRSSTELALVRDQLARERLLAMLGGFFAGVALLLAAIGLYGVLHYSVVQREREIGIRIALGAAAGNIARIVTVRVMMMVLVGAAVGLGVGVASVRFVQALLYGVKSTDVSMMVLPGLVLLAAAFLAALPVVLRAVRIDPAVMLRSDE